MQKNRISALALLFCALLGLAGQAQADDCGGATACNCGDTVISDYNLAADLNCTGHGLVIGADGITIDGNSHTITGDGGTDDYGIDDGDGYDNITIQNFANITNFYYGIIFTETTSSTIQNVTINSNSEGIYFSDSNENTITSNTANSNTNYGIYLESSNYNDLNSNDTNSNKYGIYLSSSPYNTLTNNDANSNTTHGIYLNSSNDNNLTSNTANSNTNYGIYLYSSSDNNLTSNTANSNQHGIRLAGSHYESPISDNNLTSNTANSNGENGIFLSEASSNNLTNNTANSNSNYGIYFDGAYSNTLTGNTANSNQYGIFLDSYSPNDSSLNILTGNTMSGNQANLYVFNTYHLRFGYNNTIDTTNKVEGKSVYYFYNKAGTAENPIIYDGNELGNDIGMFWCNYCDYVQVKNANFSINNYAGVFFLGTTNSTIQNVTANSNQYGIYLYGSSLNTLTSNTANSNGNYGIYLYGSYLNGLTGNKISNNKNAFFDDAIAYYANTYRNNQFSYSLGNAISYVQPDSMIDFTETTRTIDLDDEVSFDFSMFNIDGSSCSDCTPTVTTSPSEPVTKSQDSNNVTGTFTVTRPGTYSLIITVTDSNNNATKRNYLFFVDASGSQTTKYYLRGANPTHGQPAGSDSKSLLFTAPTSTETWLCEVWVQNSPDGIPDYPLANLSSINAYTWYKVSEEASPVIGVQRYLSYDSTPDRSISIPVATTYTWIDKNFTNLNWGMDYSWSWYWLAIKIAGYGINQKTTAEQPSYADFTYQYTTTPAIKSISNTDIVVLSATTPADDTNNAQIVLDGNGSTNIVVGSKRPFLGCVTDINSDGNATIFATNLTGITDLNSVSMDLTPSSGDVNVSIDTWNTSGSYYKKWAETGSAGGITAIHIVGDLKASTSYRVKVDNATFKTCQSTSSGQIGFDYNGGYSEKTFEVAENEATAPTTRDNDFNNNWNNADQNIQFRCTDTGSGCKNFHYSLDDANYQQAWNGDHNIGIAITTDGNHEIFYWSSDNADNNEAAHLIYNAVDKTAPTLTITSPPNGNKQKDMTVTLQYTATDTNSGIAKYYVRADGTSWIDNNTKTAYTFAISPAESLPATHAYYVKAVDNAGNETTASITVTIESTTHTTSGTPNAGTTTQNGTPTDYEIESCEDIACENAECAVGTCDNTTGACEYTNKNDGTSCGANKECKAGTCIEKQAAETPTQPEEQEKQEQPRQPSAQDYTIPAIAALAIAGIAIAGCYHYAKRKK